jgi:hypothetical protein
MRLTIEPTGRCAAIRGVRLHVWRGEAEGLRVLAYALIAPPALMPAPPPLTFLPTFETSVWPAPPLTFLPTFETSVCRGVLARVWRTGDGHARTVASVVLHLAVVHLDDWAPTAFARELAQLSPESFGALAFDRAAS